MGACAASLDPKDGGCLSCPRFGSICAPNELADFSREGVVISRADAEEVVPRQAYCPPEQNSVEGATEIISGSEAASFWSRESGISSGGGVSRTYVSRNNNHLLSSLSTGSSESSSSSNDSFSIAGSSQRRARDHRLPPGVRLVARPNGLGHPLGRGRTNSSRFTGRFTLSDPDEAFFFTPSAGLAAMLAAGGSPAAGFGFIDTWGRLYVGDALDVDDMGYEELLALGDRIGRVSPAPPTAEELSRLDSWEVPQLKDSLASCLKGRQDAVSPKRLPLGDCAPPECSGRAKDGCDCAVCREGFNPGQLVRRLPCLHTYHAACIDSWLCSGMPGAFRCPTCLQDVKL
mmetsp:Transcript_47186/g.85079  ORF Transcript_47186/g.85079 Transcript_47186/m.85079 type:complete len:345 (+) Transcript_47186:71-1105(+)